MIGFSSQRLAQVVALLRITLPLVTFGCVSWAQADSLRGTISIQGPNVFFIPVTDAQKPIAQPHSISASLSIRASLLGMKTGDFAVLNGELIDTDGDGLSDQVEVNAVESVGLNELIGSWRSAMWEVIRFDDFNHMSLFRPKSRVSKAGHKVGLAKLRELNYTLAPDRGLAYSIFLAEKAEPSKVGLAPVYVGRLEVRPRALKLEIIDPKTGVSSEVLSLSPVRD